VIGGFMKKRVTVCLLAMVIFLLPACSKEPNSVNGSDGTNAEQQSSNTPIVEDELAKYDFGGQEIRIMTSINASENYITNSNYMIEGEGELNGEIVNDAVYKRNMDVETLLNVKFNYTHMDEDYDTVKNAVSKLVLSGTDAYDLIINDVRTLAGLSLDGMFLNVKKVDVFDLSQSYWYNAFMEDVAIGKEKSFILAGDYFIDVLRNCHALFLNKTMLDEQSEQGTADALYQKVLDGKWTFEEFLTLTKSFLKDVNGDGEYKNADDQFGFICVGTWGSAMPFMMASDTGIFTKNTDGIPEFTMYNDKSIQLHDYLTRLFAKDSGGNSSFDGTVLVSEFQNRRSLMVGYQRLATLEHLRTMEDEVAILPYPKLNSQQAKYVTSAHDTSEVGAIPITCANFDMTCVVLEALNREAKNTIIPAYYEQSLKIKYARDDTSAQIIDIIHDSMGNVFPLAYAETLNDVLNLYDVTATKDFASGYEKREAKVKDKLETVIQSFMD
jgi:hypothetical protein